jgi:hypothetical protein
MSLKNAALAGLLGMLLLTVLLVIDLIVNFSNVLGGLIPAVILLRSLVYALAGLGVTVFFYFFYKAQA